MKLNMMRAMDYWVGVPLTFCLTWILKPFFYFKKSRPVKRLLFLELSEMGSVILANPAMEKAKKVLNAELYFVIFKKNVHSVRLLKTIPETHVFCIRENNLWVFVWDCCRFFIWTRKMKIDTVCDLELFSRVSAILTGLSGASNRVGFYRYYYEGLYRGNMLTHKVSYNAHQHIAKNFIALINTLSAKVQEVPNSKTLISDSEMTLPILSVSEHDQHLIFQKITEVFPSFQKNRDRLILINANAGDLLPQRKWQNASYVSLIQKLLDLDERNLILLTGSKNEYAHVENIVQGLKHSRCINFAGQLAFHQLPALYSLSALMVTNDSGPGHFSSITALYTYVLFGPETPQLYGPLGVNSKAISIGLACSPCVSAFNHRKIACTDNQCMKQLSVSQVLQTILKDWPKIKRVHQIDQ